MTNFTAIAFLFILFLSGNVYAEINLEEAKELVNQKKYFDALKLVSPCLVAESTKDIPNLEDCLYEGEKIAEEAVKELKIKRSEALKSLKMENFPNYLDFYNEQEAIVKKLIAPYEKLGIHPIYFEPGAEYLYKDEFFERLKRMFPNSKHRPEYEYVLIDKSASVMLQ
jgi:hypothetical protein